MKSAPNAAECRDLTGIFEPLVIYGTGKCMAEFGNNLRGMLDQSEVFADQVTVVKEDE